MRSQVDLTANEILDWRETERLRVVAVLQDRLPGLRERVAVAIDEQLGLLDTLRLAGFHDRAIAPLVEGWIKEQYGLIGGEVERSLGVLDTRLDPRRFGWKWSERIGVGAGAVLTVAPVAVVPAVASAVVVSTTTLFVFTSSAISLPVLGVALVGAAVWGGGARKVGSGTFDRVRRRYRDQVRREIESRVVGDPADPEAPSLQRALLKEIDARARARLEALK